MGVVFQARDRQTGADLAIKVLHPALATNIDIRRRFHREASILRSLEHPGLVQVQQVRDDPRGWTFITMELIEGDTLETWLARDEPNRTSSLLQLLASAADALQAAHDQGVTHGDIKPSNIFVIPSDPPDMPRAKLVDFGLCKVEGLERLTRTGEVVGTPAYMPPELITGSASSGPAADTYSLGIVLYECLAGRKPFQHRNPAQLLMQVVEGHYPPLEVCQVTLPLELAQLVEACLCSEPSERLSPISLVGTQLRHFASMMPASE